VGCKVCGAPESTGAMETPEAGAIGETVASAVPPPISSCPRCGYPAVKEEAARMLAEAAALAAKAPVDAVIRRIQQAVKADPDSWLPRLRLASAYQRKAEEGQPALLRLAQKEVTEALRLAPGEREVHAARIGIAAKTGALALVRAEYESRKDDPPAQEALRMIAAVEKSASAPQEVPSGLAKTVRFRLMLAGSVVSGLLGIGETVMMVMSTGNPGNSGDSTVMGSSDFPFAVIFVTAAVVMGLEAKRSRKGKA